MKYMGSKARHAKYMLPIILAGRRPDQWYVEPFVGGANMIDKVRGPRIGSDVNPYLPALYSALQRGWVPPHEVSEELYNAVKSKPGDYAPEFVAFLGFACSYAAKWFGGWCRGAAADGTARDYIREGRNNVLKQVPALMGIRFVCASYDRLDIPARSIIYCDPPYAGTTKYRTDFDHAAFWVWCDRKVDEGHTVFVSEYSAPAHWECVWSREIASSLDANTGGKRGVERLFTRWTSGPILEGLI